MVAPETTKNFKIAIVGGGVCGLTCAIMLSKQGVPVEIFEAASKFGEIGAGLGLGANAVRILRDIGVFDDVLSKSGQTALNMYAYRFVSGMDGHEVFYDYPLRQEDSGLGIARSAFLEALVQHVDLDHAHFNKRCISVLPSSQNASRCVISFTDGTTFEANAVIGADGIKSAVRGTVTGKRSDENVAFSNTVGYRGLVPYKEAIDAGVKTDLTAGITCFIGPDKHVIAYPIRGNEIINIVAFVTNRNVGFTNLPPGEPWVATTPEEEMMKEYEGWGTDVVSLLSRLRRPSKWSMHVVYPALESYTNGRVALIGDAAHAMFTHLGAGAGQGIEDGFVLARLLGHSQSTADNLDEILRVYDEIRRPRAQMVWERTTTAGNIYEARGPSGGSAEGVRKDMNSIWDPVWHHDLEEDVRKGVQRLRELGVFSQL